MTYADTLSKIRKAREQRDGARRALYGAQLRVLELKKQLQQRPVRQPGPAPGAAAGGPLDEARREVVVRARAAGAAAAEVSAAIGELFVQLPPQQLIAEWSDQVPIALLPLRLEVRFQTVNGRNELWVRVFPDDLEVVTHEEVLTQTEVDYGQAYWTGLFDAGQDEGKKKAAWRMVADKFGANRAAWVALSTKPTNWGDPSITDSKDLQFPEPDLTKPASWTEAPHTRVLPDRFVLMTYRNGAPAGPPLVGKPVSDLLVLGPAPMEDANAEKGSIDRDQTNNRLRFGDDFKWLTDFPAAEAAGMGFIVPLDAAGASQGFDELLVVGLKLSADEGDGKKLLEDLVTGHHYAKEGFGLVRQGTPTNNTEERDSGFSSKDPLQSLSYFVETGAPLFTPTGAAGEAADGQRLAEYLGIDYAPLQNVVNADARDHAEALAMNRALYAGTAGHYVASLLNEVMTDTAAGQLRHHFNNFVTGRGPLAAVRVGNQPYGVLLTSAFPLWTLEQKRLPGERDPFLAGLLQVLRYLEDVWKSLVPGLTQVPKATDAGAGLMKVLGLNPTSVEYFQRVGYSLDYLKNLESFQDGGKYIWDVYKAQWQQFFVPLLLQQFGYTPKRADESTKPTPLLLQLIFRHYNAQLDPLNLVDGRPLSETDQIKPYDAARARNYIHWLLETTDSQKLEAEDFGGAKKPTALLYMMLRYSLLHETGTSIFRFLLKNEINAFEMVRSAKFANISAAPTISPWEVFQVPANKLVATESATTPLYEYLHSPRFSSPADLDVVANLNEHKRALELLKDLPTARLERAFAEHVDTLTYRLDAWQTSLFERRLRELRGLDGAAGGQRRTGVYLGAYGYLEHARPNKVRRVKIADDSLPEPLREGKDNLYLAPSNGGYVHAASLNHATAAAILRNAYLTHATPAQREALAVNLSSERVRRAQYLVEGVRHGQTLEVLLGYQFERGLHDWSTRQPDPVVLNDLVPYFRQAFPIKRTKVPQAGKVTGPEETVQDFSVVNGLDLARTTLPFPYGITFPPLTGAKQAAIQQEKANIENTLDAMRDLLTAESAYQLALGNFDRAAGAMQAMSAGQMPPEIDVVNTARGTDLAFTNRVMVHFDAALATNPWPGVPVTARAQMEPGLNHWVGTLLGDPGKVRCRVTSPAVDEVVTLEQLQVQPLDFMYLIRSTLESTGTSELETRVRYRVARAHALADDVVITIKFADAGPAAGPDVRSFAEVLPLANALRELVGGAKPLGARSYQVTSRDVAAAPDNPDAADVPELEARVDAVHTAFTTRFGQLATAVTAAETLKTEAAADALRDRLKAVADAGYVFAFPLSAKGFAQEQLDVLVTQGKSLGTRFQALEDAYQAQLLKVNGAGTKPVQQLSLLTEMARAMLGADYQVLPRFQLAGAAEVAQSYAARDQLLAHARGALQMPLPVDEWLHGVSQVRPTMRWFETVRLLQDAWNGAFLDVFPLQLPYRNNDSWLAVQYPAGTTILHDTLALAVHAPQGFAPAAAQCGLLVDEWTESVPNREEVTGLTFNYDNPNSAPPQALLLAVAPRLAGRWSWDDLVATIRDTFARARQRAVEPDMVDGHGLITTLLPALVSEFSTSRTNVSLDLSLNIAAVAAAVAALAPDKKG